MSHFCRILPRLIPAGRQDIGVAFLTAALVACGGCGRPPGELASDAALATAASSSTTRTPAATLPRDDAGHLIPRTPPPPLPADAGGPKPSRDPDWDLDAQDPARDYAFRYAAGTKRYGDGGLGCAEFEASTPTGDERSVAVRRKEACGGAAAGGVRDVFLVDVADDRLTVDDKCKRDALARWPDGSDPEGPASRVRQVDDLRRWQGPLGDAFRKLALVPIRVQGYGRGTYPVVTIAGWHGAVTPQASGEDLQRIAIELCRANGGLPMGVFAGIDRSRMLRIRCPAEARWDRL